MKNNEFKKILSSGIEKKEFWSSYISIEVPNENTSNEWLELVSDEEYDGLGENSVEYYN